MSTWPGVFKTGGGGLILIPTVCKGHQQMIPAGKVIGCLAIAVGTIVFGGIFVMHRAKLVPTVMILTLKAPITTEAENKFRDIFPNFRQK